MARLLATIAMLAAVAAGACRNDAGTGPRPANPTYRPVPGATGSQPGPPSLATASVRPQWAALLNGATVRLVVLARDVYGREMTGAAIEYASSDSGVASVDRFGEVTARGPGRARISAKATSGSRSAVSTMEVHVFAFHPGEGNVLVSGPSGWEPSEVEVAAGSTVTWLAAPISWAGTSQDKVYLLDANWFMVDSIPLTNGIGTYRVGEAGTLRYCSGWCWEPPDFGVIHIR